jgi:nucleoside-diphosphate kinase
MQITVVILKPSAIQRNIMGKVISRFEHKGLQVVGMKMMQLSDEILKEHYAHLADKPFFKRIKDGMQASPVIVLALRGVDVINVVRKMTGTTIGREAQPGTIRGDFSMSRQENIVHASDCTESAEAELKRFFSENEIFDYSQANIQYIYVNDDYV